MKFFHALLAMILMALSTSCLHVVFEEPPTMDNSFLETFPPQMQGSFLLEDDTITVGPNYYVAPEATSKVVNVNSLPNGIVFTDSLLFDPNSYHGRWVPYEREGDVLYYDLPVGHKIGISDTMRLSRYDEDRWVLSRLDANLNAWDVMLLAPTALHLKAYLVGNFKVPDEPDQEGVTYDAELKRFLKHADFERLDAHTYRVRATPKQFRRLVKKGFFVEGLNMERLR